MAISDDLRAWFDGVFHDEQGGEKLSLTALAKESGVARSTINGLRDGTRETDQATINAVARALGVQPPRLVIRLESMPIEPRPLARLRQARLLIEGVEADLTISAEPAHPPDDVKARVQVKDRQRRPGKRKSGGRHGPA